MSALTFKGSLISSAGHYQTSDIINYCKLQLSASITYGLPQRSLIAAEEKMAMLVVIMYYCHHEN